MAESPPAAEPAAPVAEPRTHRRLDPRWSGRPVDLAAGRATVELPTSAEMAADDLGLVHGGFVFSLADHAAMLAVDHPNVVLGAAEVRFLAPVRVGERLVAEAVERRREGKKILVEVTVLRGTSPVLTGLFTCFVPERHVLAGADRATATGESA